MNKKRNKAIFGLICFIWILTFLAGFLGRWNNITFVLFPVITVVLTIFCIVNIIKKRYCNVCLGICQLYFSLIGLILVYKIFYWQFKISAWYLVGGVFVLVIFDLFELRKFIKNNKEAKKMKDASLWIMMLLVLLITSVLWLYIKRTFPANQLGASGTLGIISLIILIIFPFSAVGMCHLVLDDSKMLYPVKPD